MAGIILDNASSNLTCSDSQCNFSSTFSNSWLNGTAVTDDNPGPVTLTFSGTSAAFYASGVLDRTDNVTISIDEQQAVLLLSSFQDPWFSTGTLPDGQHNVTFERLPDGFIVDYMVITASEDTPLLGKQLILDDSDSSLIYAGKWTENTTTLLISPESALLSPGPPATYHATCFGGGFQETQDQQASVQITFTVAPGTSISVYGIYDLEFSPMIATFAIDGENQASNFGLSLAGNIVQANYPLFQSRLNLSPGNHVLSITFGSSITAPFFGTGGRFTLDYITYTPSFSSLATQGETTHSTDKRPILVDATIGAVVGALLIASIIFVLWKKFKAKKASVAARLIPDPYPGAPDDTITPGAWRPPAMPVFAESRKIPVSGRQRGPDVVQVSQSNRPISRILDEPQLVAVNPTIMVGPSDTNAETNRPLSRILDEPQVAAANLTTMAGPSNTDTQKNQPISGTPDEPQPAAVNITPMATAVNTSTTATAVNTSTTAGLLNSNAEDASDPPPSYDKIDEIR